MNLVLLATWFGDGQRITCRLHIRRLTRRPPFHESHSLAVGYVYFNLLAA